MDTEMSHTDRRYDIDWLRVIAIGLLLLYHIGIVFQPWAVFLGFLQSNEPIESLWPPMAMLNVWRIPLLFFVSGMGVCFAIRKRNWKQLIIERTRRILVPFLFGMVILVPIHVLIWQNYYHQDLRYAPHPGHLWFLGNIFIYVVLLSPLFFLMRNRQQGRVLRGLSWLFSNPLGLLLITALFVLETLAVRPERYAMFAFTFHGFLLGLVAFLSGFTVVITGPAFWNTVRRWRWIYLVAAVMSYMIRYLVFGLEAPGILAAAESTFWIFSALGFGYRYLNRPGKTLNYLSQAAYPVYILHMIFLYAGASLILPLEIPAVFQLILVTGITAAGCMGSYEIIRRLSFLRPLFGLKTAKKGVSFRPGGHDVIRVPQN
jgi:membrane-bound acyltransferase YfiQ involved in biofilm formation